MFILFVGNPVFSRTQIVNQTAFVVS